MSEENKSTNEEFDKFLNKKEQEGGAFENEKSSTKETKPNKNKNLGTVNMTRYGQEQGDKSDFVLGYHKINMDDLFSKGRFYPADAVISIRSAKVA